MAEPAALHRALIPPGHVVQTGDLADKVVNMGLTILDPDGVRRPMLAETLPTLENGLWKLLPDGRMELTWKIRPGATWHDGTPFTADDIVFTVAVAEDREIPEFRSTGTADFLESVEAVDAATLVARWRTAYFKADHLWATSIIPKHLLETSYRDRKDAFRQLPYWSTDYVGLGPYKVREWVSGSHLILSPHEGYALGRPKIDELEVRFILDANTMVANIVSGAVQMTIGTGLNLEQAIQVREQWRDGKMAADMDAWVYAAAQFINPNPVVITDLRFRRALIHAVDRQVLADSIQAGMVPPADVNVRPNEPEYRDIERFIVRHPYDLGRANQLIAELGYVKGADGMLVDAAGQKLELEVRATASPAIHAKTMQPVADYWQRLGITISQVIIPVQRLTDFEYRTTMPGIEVVRYGTGADRIDQLHGSKTPLPENRYSGTNRSRYLNPDFDGMIDRYFATIQWAPRMQALGTVANHITDQLVVMGMIYDVAPVLIGRQLENVATPNPTWNIHQWGLKA
jgi:peptide/nickel transport system substrate-binding protein